MVQMESNFLISYIQILQMEHGMSKAERQALFNRVLNHPQNRKDNTLKDKDL